MTEGSASLQWVHLLVLLEVLLIILLNHSPRLYHLYLQQSCLVLCGSYSYHCGLRILCSSCSLHSFCRVSHAFSLQAESTEETHGKALSLANVGGQLAYIVSPLLLEELYNQQADLPFFITLIPAIILVVVMLMCSYLPGGKLAGQVSLADSLEHNAKVGIMTEDNEYETEFLGSTTVSGNGKNDKKRNLRVQRRQLMPEEPSSLPEDAEAFNLTASIRKQFGDDTMEI